ncbi:MAG: flagellar biosynthetic protein FliQ [Candidatus Caenarcaniphilales bacterium]|nr:flagellar biosynthetic protein FliQ [Candidatus Caenarcaniphilales bacterium]
MNWMLEPVREAVMTILIVTAPIVLIAAGIGLVVGIIQAATQVQEQTTSFALKLVGVLGMFLVTGMWMFGYLTDFATKTIGTSFTKVIEQREPVDFPVDSAAQTFTQPLIQKTNANGQPTANSADFQASLAPPLQAFNNAIQTQPENYNYTVPVVAPTKPSSAPPLRSKPGTQSSQAAPTPKPQRKASLSNNTTSPNKVELQPPDTVTQPLKIIRPVIPSSLDLGNNTGSTSIDKLPPPGATQSQSTASESPASTDSTTTWW